MLKIRPMVSNQNRIEVSVFVHLAVNVGLVQVPIHPSLHPSLLKTLCSSSECTDRCEYDRNAIKNWKQTLLDLFVKEADTDDNQGTLGFEEFCSFYKMMSTRRDLYLLMLTYSNLKDHLDADDLARFLNTEQKVHHPSRIKISFDILSWISFFFDIRKLSKLLF